MSEELRVISGTVSNLSFHDGEQAFMNLAHRSAGVAAAAGLAATGLAGAAASAGMAATSSSDAIQFFTCTLDEQVVMGQLSRVTFKDGDVMSFVIEEERSGAMRALAATRPNDQILWMPPHCSRGVRAHRRFSMRMFVWLLFGMPAFIWLSFLILGVWTNSDPVSLSMIGFAAILSLAMGVIVAVYYPISFYYQWRPTARRTERILAALGYPDPSSVDLPRDDKVYAKANGRHSFDAPWIYRYLDPKKS